MASNQQELVRCAFFNGRIKPGMEDAFNHHVDAQMAPLWTCFPGVREVRVLRQFQSDTEEPVFPLVMVMYFGSHEDIASALVSPARRESQLASRTLLDMFEGSVFHTVFGAQAFPLRG